MRSAFNTFWISGSASNDPLLDDLRRAVGAREQRIVGALAPVARRLSVGRHQVAALGRRDRLDENIQERPVAGRERIRVVAREQHRVDHARVVHGVLGRALLECVAGVRQPAQVLMRVDRVVVHPAPAAAP